MKQKEMSLATKRELAAALKKLIAVKPINKITVRELVAPCGMNRNSFYYHFEDIYALFKWMVEAEAVEVVKQYDLMMDYHEVINFVLDYVESNQYLLTNAYNAVGQAGLKRFLYLDFISCLHKYFLHLGIIVQIDLLGRIVCYHSVTRLLVSPVSHI